MNIEQDNKLNKKIEKNDKKQKWATIISIILLLLFPVLTPTPFLISCIFIIYYVSEGDTLRKMRYEL